MSNSLIRSISGAVFFIVMTGAILLHPVSYIVIMLFAITVMTFEYLKITAPDSHSIYLPATVSASILLFLSIFFGKKYPESAGILFLTNTITFALIFILPLFFTKVDQSSKRITGGDLAGAIIYTALPFSLVNLIAIDSSGEFSPMILFSMFLILWASDVGAYVFGMLFGQKNGHKLFPSVSPKKSWEGFAGGVIAAVLTGVAVSTTGLWDINLSHSIILSLIINIAGVFGDLAESLLKRKYGVKDSGNIMPGHGGLLDRFDGALLAFPLAVSYITLFNLA